MIVLFLGAFIAGLLLAVGIMLFGIEKRSTPAAEAPTRPLRVSLPLLAAFAVGFGASGYLLTRAASGGAALLGAVGIGAATALVMRWLVAKSAAMVPEHDIEDERYVLQGHIARVVAAIAPGSAGGGA